MSSEAKKSILSLFPLIFLHQTIGAFGFPITKLGVQELDPFVFAFFRFLIAAGALSAYVWWRDGKTPGPAIERSDWPRIALLAFLMVGCNQLGYVVGQRLTGAGHGSLLYATTPIYVFLLSAWLIGEPLSWRRGVGIIVAVAGVILIVGQGARLSREYMLGDIIIFFSVLGWAAYTVLGKPLVAKYGALRMTSYPLAIGAVCYAPFGFWRALQVDYATLGWHAWGGVLFMALGMSVIAYVTWYYVLSHMDASRLALFSNIQPLIAVIASWFMFNEAPTVLFAVGAIVVIAGLLFAEWPGAVARPRESG